MFAKEDDIRAKRGLTLRAGGEGVVIVFFAEREGRESALVMRATGAKEAAMKFNVLLEPTRWWRLSMFWVRRTRREVPHTS